MRDVAIPLAIFILVAALLTATLLINNPGVLAEHADHAANSLLILEAKRLELLVGNYSRIGFNHPGPALLYFFAAGEVLLHDTLHWVASPFSAQLVAGALWCAGWLTAFYVLLRRLLKDTRATLVVFVGFIAALNLALPDVLINVWFPFLYVLPFAVFTLAIARIAAGRLDELPLFGFAAGVLWNGHVSFLAITFIMFVFAAWAYFARLRELGADPFVELLAARWRILVAIVIAALFLAPLVVVTIADYPEPLKSYFGGGRRNEVFASIGFVAQYWLAKPVVVAAIALGAGMLIGGRSNLRALIARPLAVAMIAATGAVLFYALFGVDVFDQPYIAFFYYAVPSLCAGLALLMMVDQASGLRRVGTAMPLLAVIAALWIAGSIVLRPTGPNPGYNAKYGDKTIEALLAATQGEPVALETVPDQNHWFDWGILVGTQLHALRQGIEFPCIGEGWHILYTAKARCTAEQRASLRTLYVRSVRLPGRPVELEFSTTPWT